jgi:hypothetical protein
VIGCTTAEQLSEVGFQRGGLSGASLSSDELSVTPYLIHPLSSQAEQVAKITKDIQDRLSLTELPAFVFLLVDGLSMKGTGQDLFRMMSLKTNTMVLSVLHQNQARGQYLQYNYPLKGNSSRTPGFRDA